MLFFLDQIKGNLLICSWLCPEAGAWAVGPLCRICAPNEEMTSFCPRRAVALVMPTYFGPTNIPPLEGVLFRVPCLLFWIFLVCVIKCKTPRSWWIWIRNLDPWQVTINDHIENAPDIVLDKVKKGKTYCIRFGPEDDYLESTQRWHLWSIRE